MAKEDREEDTGTKKPEKKSNKMLFIIVGAVIFLALIGVGAVLALKGGKSAEEGAEGGEDEAAVEEEGGEGAELPGAMMPLEPFIVNLRLKGSFLKATLELEFGEPEVPKVVESQTPKIRDTVIRILSSKDSAEILTKEGKEKLRAEIKEEVNKTLNSEDIVGVYFSEFIVQ